MAAAADSGYISHMRILGIDTSGPLSSVALLEGGSVRAEERFPEGARPSADIVPALQRILGEAGVRVEDVDAFAAVRGPGSFTGLRVGLATARGLALASGRPAAGMCALDLLARQAPREASTVCALIDAGRGEVYAGIYRADGESWSRQGAYQLLSPEAAAGLAGAAVYLGSGAAAGRARLEACPGARIAPHRPWLAADAARELGAALARGERIDPETLRPLYIRPSEAERTGRWGTTISVLNR